ncbi:hypothetical protein BT96DRAFT_1027213 [Gymnopus androsaceus JB14]|uniref:Uncharacterized protein n=1 Tax=Gymnopus androsaceus JB14 TaxID=1447944 RepID=A0A6A4GDM1_9AGAR|nr:hypothetical protein BT96DRAFT_1027213 [Gymnopus androsaceus JB14]
MARWTHLFEFALVCVLLTSSSIASPLPAPQADDPEARWCEWCIEHMPGDR